MALEATHIRFALDLSAFYGVRDLNKCVSGSIYPDSRYPTGVARELTHRDDLVTAPLSRLSDFQKGWRTHMICDALQYNACVKRFPHAFAPGKVWQGNESWVNFTALKVLQDIDDVAKFPLADYLSGLDYIETPNNEDPEAIRSYNRFFQKLYQGGQPLSVKGAYDTWIMLGVGHDLADQIARVLERYQQDESIKKLIPELYPEMLAAAKKFS